MDLVQIRMRLEGGKQVAAESDVAASGMAKVEESAVSANKATAASSASLSSNLKKAGSSMKSVGSSMTKYLTVPILGVAAVTGKMAFDFDRDMRNVNSIAQLPQKQFEGLTQRVLNLAGPTAQAPHVLAEGLYDLVSSGFNANESIKILHSSALAASAGLTTTEVSTKAVAAALNAYELPASKAAMVSDTLFETVNRGVLTFDELASSVGDVLPFSSQLKINLGEVGASISTMTKAGLSSSESVTRLKNAMVAFIKPSKPLKELLDEMGTTGEKIVAKRGFQGALEAIVKHTDGTKESIAELFPNIRAMGGVLALTGLHAKSAGEDVEAFQVTTGATNKVLKEQEKSFGFQLQRAWAELQAVLIEVGQQVLPVVVPLIKDLANALKLAAEWFGNLSPPMQKALLIFLGIVAVAGPLLIFMGSLVTAVIALDAVLSPILLIPAAIIAVGAAIYFAYKYVKPFHDAVDALMNVLGGVVNYIGLVVAAFFPLAGAAVLVIHNLDWITNAFNNVVHFFVALPGRIWGAIKKLPYLIGSIIGHMINLWLTLPIRLPQIIVKTGVRVIHALIAIVPGAVSAGIKIAGGLAHGIASGASAIWGFIKSIPAKLAAIVQEIVPALLRIGGEIGSQIAKGIFEALPGPVKDALKGAAGLGGELIEGAGEILPFASGTNRAPGGLSLVGEHGPELMNVPFGSQIIPAARTSRLLGGSEAPARGTGLGTALARSGGGSRPAITVPVYLDRRKIAEAQVEATEDAAARL